MVWASTTRTLLCSRRCCSGRRCKSSLPRNQLSEAGLLQLADALLAIEGGHARLTMLAVANQKGALSTLALTRLLDAMAMTPSLTLDYTHAFTA